MGLVGCGRCFTVTNAIISTIIHAFLGKRLAHRAFIRETASESWILGTLPRRTFSTRSAKGGLPRQSKKPASKRKRAFLWQPIKTGRDRLVRLVLYDEVDTPVFLHASFIVLVA